MEIKEKEKLEKQLWCTQYQVYHGITDDREIRAMKRVTQRTLTRE